MRFRALVSAALAAATMLTPAANAGTGVTNACNDGLVALARPITVGIKTTTSGNNTKVWICFSTTPPGEAGSGQVLHLDLWRNTDTNPGVYAAIGCYFEGIGVPCTVHNSANLEPDDIDVEVADSSTCAVYVGGCLQHVPSAVSVRLNDDPSSPLLAITIGNESLRVDAPVPCIGILAAC